MITSPGYCAPACSMAWLITPLYSHHNIAPTISFITDGTSAEPAENFLMFCSEEEEVCARRHLKNGMFSGWNWKVMITDSPWNKERIYDIITPTHVKCYHQFIDIICCSLSWNYFLVSSAAWPDRLELFKAGVEISPAVWSEVKWSKLLRVLQSRLAVLSPASG